LIDQDKPPGVDTLRKWHDYVRGPRDNNGRRIFTTDVCRRIEYAMAKRRATPATAGRLESNAHG
jgi:hypothetical protein